MFSYILPGLSASTPRIWSVSLFAKSRGRYQPFGANSKVSSKGGNWNSLPPQRRGTAATGFRLTAHVILLEAKQRFDHFNSRRFAPQEVMMKMVVMPNVFSSFESSKGSRCFQAL